MINYRIRLVRKNEKGKGEIKLRAEKQTVRVDSLKHYWKLVLTETKLFFPAVVSGGTKILNLPSQERWRR